MLCCVLICAVVLKISREVVKRRQWYVSPVLRPHAIDGCQGKALSDHGWGKIGESRIVVEKQTDQHCVNVREFVCCMWQRVCMYVYVCMCMCVCVCARLCMCARSTAQR